METINYTIAKSKAYQLQLIGFGLTQAIRDYYLDILNRIDIDELTHIVAISFYRAHAENINFYKAICNEIAEMGMYKKINNQHFVDAPHELKNVAASEGIDEKSMQYRQVRNLYLGLGLKRFHQYVCPDQNFSNVRRWTYEAFREKGNRGGRNVNHKIIDKVMSKGGWIAISNTTSSVYIKNNETKIRISDHKTNDKQADYEILVPKI